MYCTAWVVTVSNCQLHKRFQSAQSDDFSFNFIWHHSHVQQKSWGPQLKLWITGYCICKNGFQATIFKNFFLQIFCNKEHCLLKCYCGIHIKSFISHAYLVIQWQISRCLTKRCCKSSFSWAVLKLWELVQWMTGIWTVLPPSTSTVVQCSMNWAEHVTDFMQTDWLLCNIQHYSQLIIINNNVIIKVHISLVVSLWPPHYQCTVITNFLPYVLFFVCIYLCI